MGVGIVKNYANLRDIIYGIQLKMYSLIFPWQKLA